MSEPKRKESSMPIDPTRFGSADPGPFFHGTKVGRRAGDLLEPGWSSNFGEGKQANFVYLTAVLDAAVWGAELAQGDAPGRIYLVEPTGPFEDDPNLTDKKFPGNVTRSYRTREPLRVLGEVVGWTGPSPRGAAGDARSPRGAQAAGRRGDQRVTAEGAASCARRASGSSARAPASSTPRAERSRSHRSRSMTPAPAIQGARSQHHGRTARSPRARGAAHRRVLRAAGRGPCWATRLPP